MGIEFDDKKKKYFECRDQRVIKGKNVEVMVEVMVEKGNIPMYESLDVKAVKILLPLFIAMNQAKEKGKEIDQKEYYKLKKGLLIYMRLIEWYLVHPGMSE